LETVGAPTPEPGAPPPRPKVRVRVAAPPLGPLSALAASVIVAIGVDRALRDSVATGLALAVAAGAISAFATRRDPQRRAFLRALALAAWASALVVAGAWLMHGGSVSPGLGIALFGRFPWYGLACIAGAAGGRAGTRSTAWMRVARAAVAATAWYAGVFVLVFLPRPGEPHPYVEQLDSLGRAAVVGPKMGLVGETICPGEGPCFLWSCDHTGKEWLYRFQRPLVRLWFVANESRYYDPDRARR